jgi:hypothetical protein
MYKVSVYFTLSLKRIFLRVSLENSGFAAPTLSQHISMFRGYQILFSIRNPYINRFTNHFSIHSQPSYLQKVALHSILP